MQRVETAVDPRTTPVLAGGARTPVGRFRGALSDVPAVELGAHAVRAALSRCPGLEPEYVAMGNVLQAANGQNPSRRAAVLGGVGREVPGITLSDEARERMRLAGPDGRREGVKMAQELLQELRPLVQGVYLMPSFGRYEVAAEVLSILQREPVAR